MSRTPRGGQTHAPPRSRIDPFGDFASTDHSAILSSLANERQNAAQKKELACNAGALLRQHQRQRQQQPQYGSVSRQSNASTSSVTGGGGGGGDNDSMMLDDGDDAALAAPPPPHHVSQLRRLRETMSAFGGGGGPDNAFAAAAQQPTAGGGGGLYQQQQKTGSPSRDDMGAFFTHQNASSKKHHHHHRRGGGGGGDASAGSSPHSSVDRDAENNFGLGGGVSPAPSGYHSNQKSVGLSHNTAQHILRDMQGLRDSLTRLEQHLMSDMKRRVESHAALQRTVELRVREIAENAEKRGQDRMVKLHHTLDALTQRVSKLEGALATEREKNVRLVQELKYHSVRGLQEIKQQLAQERNARSERIASASQDFGHELFRVEEHIAVAKRAREALSEEVRDAVVRAQQARTESEDKLLQSLMSDIERMKSKIEIETRERESGEEQLAGAMADLAQHLQSL